MNHIKNGSHASARLPPGFGSSAKIQLRDLFFVPVLDIRIDVLLGERDREVAVLVLLEAHVRVGGGAPGSIAFVDVASVLGLTLAGHGVAVVREPLAVVGEFLLGEAPTDQIREAAAFEPALDELLLLDLVWPVWAQHSAYMRRTSA